MKKIVLSTLLASSLVACNQDDTTTNHSDGFSFESGFLVTNEGNFQSNNADITYFTTDFSKTENQIFRKVNNRPLGDVAQSIIQNNEYVFVMMNNSNTIEIVKKKTFESVATIHQNINAPRYATISHDKIWVANAGNNTISFYNLSDFSNSGTISLDFTPEYIESTNDYVYVSSNAWADTNQVAIYDATTAMHETTLTYDHPINGIAKHNHTIYILASGDSHTQLHAINDTTSELLDENESIASRFLAFDANKLYYTTGTQIKQFDLTTDNTTTLFEVPDTGWSAVYGFNVYQQHFFVADAKSFVEAGEIVIYNASGQKVQTIKTGIGPNAVYKIH